MMYRKDTYCHLGTALCVRVSQGGIISFKPQSSHFKLKGRAARELKRRQDTLHQREEVVEVKSGKRSND